MAVMMSYACTSVPLKQLSSSISLIMKPCGTSYMAACIWVMAVPLMPKRTRPWHITACKQVVYDALCAGDRDGEAMPSYCSETILAELMPMT